MNKIIIVLRDGKPYKVFSEKTSVTFEFIDFNELQEKNQVFCDRVGIKSEDFADIRINEHVNNQHLIKILDSTQDEIEFESI